MSTNNFPYKNICVVVHDDLDDDSTYWIDGDIAEWSTILHDNVKNFSLHDTSKWTKNGALILGSVAIYNKYTGEHYADVVATYKSGYYHGAYLDYDVIYNDYYSGTRICAVEREAGKKCNALARQLRKLGTEIVKVGQFSNGEAVYKLASEV